MSLQINKTLIYLKLKGLRPQLQYVKLICLLAWSSHVQCYILWVATPGTIPVAVPSVKVIGTVISLLLITPPDIITVADITLDDSDPLNVDDENVIIATIQ